MTVKGKYKVCNWKDYNKSLIQRGSINVWFSEDAAKKWLIPIPKNKFIKERNIFEAKFRLEIATNLGKFAKSKTEFRPKRIVDFMNLFFGIGINLMIKKKKLQLVG